MEIKNLFDELNTNIPDESSHAKSLLGNKKLIIYGAGNDFNQFRIHVLERCDIQISIVIDRKFKPGSFLGVGQCHPDDYKPSQDDLENAIALVCIRNPSSFKEAMNYLQVKGFKTILKSHDIYEHYCILRNEELARDSTAYYKANQEEIDKAYSMLSDQLSRDVYLAFMRSFMFKKFTGVPHSDKQIQYFPTDLPFNINARRWINAGAYKGDTVAEYEYHFGDLGDGTFKAQTVFCFEPDFENYNDLLDYVYRISDMKKKITSFPFGLWSDNSILKFRSGISKACRLNENGETLMQCVALDDFSVDFRPTYINMDIEGAELEALKGARAMIKKYKPDLGICVYHSPNHIWEIPAYLNSLECGYKFYLRNYTGFVVETVLYATTQPTSQVDLSV